MVVVFGDATIGVKSTGKEYLFSCQTAGLESLKKDGKEWLFRSPKPAFWRATTCNDRGNSFSRDSAIWMGADMFSHLKGVSVDVDGTLLGISELTAPGNAKLLASPLRNAECVAVSFTYLTATDPQAEVVVRYTVTDAGLRIDYEYNGTEGLPSLPVCGLRIAMPFAVSSYDYEGLSGETYPDRICGGVQGGYHVSDLSLAKYVVPQECGMHMDTERLAINYKDSQLVVESTGGKFNFSLLPYTPLEIESAFHHEELPPVRRTYLTLAARVRGIGGINSWGAKPEARYEIPADGRYSFSVILK